MKTAEETFIEMYLGLRENLTIQEICVRCMKDYAKQVAGQVLKETAEHFDMETNRNIILSTPIVTP